MSLKDKKILLILVTPEEKSNYLTFLLNPVLIQPGNEVFDSDKIFLEVH